MRWIITLFTLLLVALQLELWFGDSRLPELRRMEQNVAEQSAANQALLEENQALAAEIQDLRQAGAATEERARSELGLTLPGETLYQVTDIEDR